MSRVSPYVLSIWITVAAGVVLLAMGRVPICACGTIKLWHGITNSAENSQHLTDWYSFTHIVHGLLFYWLFWYFKPDWTIGQRFAAAVFVECAWEIAENTPLIIDRYRAATISLDYYGDSVINSLGDIASMAIGFCFAATVPVWASIGFGALIEASLAYFIRDNLTLNILMLLYPLEAVKIWQAATGL